MKIIILIGGVKPGMSPIPNPNHGHLKQGLKDGLLLTSPYL